jgi:phage FluMu protein Com
LPAAASQALAPADRDCRCLCGSLLARRIGDAVELKCRRCKRTLVIPLHPEARGNPSRAQSDREARGAPPRTRRPEPGACLSAPSASDS